VEKKTSEYIPLATKKKPALKVNFESVMNYKNETSLAQIPEKQEDDEVSKRSQPAEERKVDTVENQTESQESDSDVSSKSDSIDFKVIPQKMNEPGHNVKSDIAKLHALSSTNQLDSDDLIKRELQFIKREAESKKRDKKLQQAKDRKFVVNFYE
jgi:hypothetical protein